MGKRGTNLDNISPLKARRRELRQHATTAERILWRHLQRRQLLGKKFRRQYSIGPFIVDFFCVECELGIELDGAPHYLELKEDYETARTAFLESLGVELIRFENRDVHTNVEAVLETDSPRDKEAKFMTSPAALTDCSTLRPGSARPSPLEGGDIICLSWIVSLIAPGNTWFPANPFGRICRC